MNPDIAEYPCTNCTERLGDVFIECVKCEDLRLCLECFSCGAEFSNHERIHPYKVRNAKGRCIFPHGDSSSIPWSSSEEIALLDAVERYNLGNWADVVSHVGNRQRTPKELRDHYDKFYIRGKIGKITRKNLNSPLIEDCTKSLSVGDSPSTSRDLSSKVNADDLAMLSYIPNRDDFEKEYNNDAENAIANLSVVQDDDDEVDKSLKLAQIDSYIKQLAERERRKRIIHDYDLISEFFKQEKPQPSTSFRYTPQAALKLKRERELKESLRKFTSLIPASEFNDLISSITKQRFIQDRIVQLEQLQKKGVKTLPEAFDGGSTCAGGKNAGSAPEARLPAPIRWRPTAREQPKSQWPPAANDAKEEARDNGIKDDENEDENENENDQIDDDANAAWPPWMSRQERRLCADGRLAPDQLVLVKLALLVERRCKQRGQPLRQVERPSSSFSSFSSWPSFQASSSLSSSLSSSSSSQPPSSVQAGVRQFMVDAGWLPVHS